MLVPNPVQASGLRTPGRLKITLHAGQAQVWDSKARFPSMLAGTGGGKSWLGPRWLVREMSRRGAAEGDDYLAVGPTWRMVRRIIVPGIVNHLKEVRQFKQYKRADGEIHLNSGSIIWLGSAENPLSIEGVHVKGGWGDEPGQWSLEAWEVCQRRVGHQKGRFLLTTTPYSENWLKTEILDRANAGDPDYEVVTFPSYWNPTYDVKEYLRAKRTMPKWRFDMFYNGHITRPEGLVYETGIDDMWVDALPEGHEAWHWGIGLDLGWNNATAAVIAVRSPDDVLYICGEHYVRETSLDQHARALGVWKELRPRRMLGVFYDPQAAQIIDELSGKPNMGGWPWTPANNAVLAGILEVQARAKTGKLKFVRGACPHTADEWGLYRWAKKNPNSERVYDPLTQEIVETTDAPIKANDHAMDALRYLCMGMHQMVRPGVRVID